MPYDFATDFAAMTDPNVFGEPATYTAVANGGAESAVQGVAIRNPLVANGGERTATKHIEFHVSASPTGGIPAKPVRNKDTITIAWNIGDEPAAYIIAEIGEQDAGGWVLKLKGL